MSRPPVGATRPRVGASRPPARRWARRSVLITAGPTREHLDPIRFMTNASTGTMGFALARAARSRGADVTVVLGPCGAPGSPGGGSPLPGGGSPLPGGGSPLPGVRVVPVVSALEMHRAVLARWRKADVVIGAAAVGDWRFVKPSARKLKRSPGPLTLRLVCNPDIIADVARRARRDRRRRVVVGFALETTDWLGNARRKLESKGLDLVVANRPDALGGSRSRAALVARGAPPRRLAPMSKGRLADRILDAVEASLA